ncbi:MAG: DUF1176 domain-containing protein [Rhizobiaceae bacterium]
MLNRLALMTLFLCAATAAMAGPRKEVRNMVVTCTNGLTCTLRAPVGSGDIDSFSLQRKAGPNTPTDLILSTSKPFQTGSTIHFSVDGKAVVQMPLSGFAFDSEQGQYRLSGGPEMKKLLDAMRKGHVMTIDYAGATGPGSANISLAGLIDGFLFMDEVQDRVSSLDALQARGPKQSIATHAQDILSIDEIPPQIRSEFVAQDGVCRITKPESFKYMGGFQVAVANGTNLVGLPCGDGGAYNQPFAFYLSSQGHISRLGLPVMVQQGPTVTTKAWNVDWDPRGSFLTGFFKGRGLGDCGTWRKWVLKDSGEGPAFILLEARSKDNCDGNFAGGPEHWQAQWPLSVK